jgi:beta-lactam-binding protein with PASTA domain
MSILKTILKNTFVKNILLAVVVFAGLTVGILRWLDHYTRHGEVVAVPNIKGLQLSEAVPFLLNAGLRYEVNVVHVKNARAGSIVELIPPAGSKVKDNRIIFLTLNATSAEMLTVPEVKDLSQRQALAMLRSSGFERVLIKIVPSTYEDLVVGLEYNYREVSAGEKIPSTAQLTLLVSSGMETGEDAELSDTVPSDESRF